MFFWFKKLKKKILYCSNMFALEISFFDFIIEMFLIEMNFFIEMNFLIKTKCFFDRNEL